MFGGPATPLFLHAYCMHIACTCTGEFIVFTIVWRTSHTPLFACILHVQWNPLWDQYKFRTFVFYREVVLISTSLCFTVNFGVLSPTGPLKEIPLYTQHIYKLLIIASHASVCLSPVCRAPVQPMPLLFLWAMPSETVVLRVLLWWVVYSQLIFKRASVFCWGSLLLLVYTFGTESCVHRYPSENVSLLRASSLCLKCLP